jgi:hypothetical protein
MTTLYEKEMESYGWRSVEWHRRRACNIDRDERAKKMLERIEATANRTVAVMRFNEEVAEENERFDRCLTGCSPRAGCYFFLQGWCYDPGNVDKESLSGNAEYLAELRRMFLPRIAAKKFLDDLKRPENQDPFEMAIPHPWIPQPSSDDDSIEMATELREDMLGNWIPWPSGKRSRPVQIDDDYSPGPHDDDP